MRFRVFISSVQREFAAERQILAEYVRKDPLFRDRLEIMNPGTLPPGWTAETLLTTHESIPRNKVIAKALDWAGYVERSGHGTEFIVEKCEAQGLTTPQYKPDSALFHTIIWRKTIVEGCKSQGTSLTPPMGEVVGGVEAQSGTSRGDKSGTSRVAF